MDGFLRTFPAVIAAAGWLAIGLSPAPVSWKIVAACALALTAWRGGRGRDPAATLQILPDGAIRLEVADDGPLPASLRGNPWTSRWFSFLTLFESGSGIQYHVVICASINPPDEYRRLLQFLRMRGSSTDTPRNLWL